MKLFWNQYFKLFSFCKSRKRNCKTFCSGFTETWIQTWTCVETLRRLPTDVRFSFMTKINFFKRKKLVFFYQERFGFTIQLFEISRAIKMRKGSLESFAWSLPFQRNQPSAQMQLFLLLLSTETVFYRFLTFFSSSFSWKFNFGKYFSHWFTAIVTKRFSQFTPA